MGRYVQVAEEEGLEPIELPVEEDGTMLLTTLTSQFPGASGLKYRNEETGTIRAVSLSESKFQPPESGWTSSSIFYCVFPKGSNHSFFSLLLLYFFCEPLFPSPSL